VTGPPRGVAIVGGVGAQMFRRGSGVVPAKRFRVRRDGQARILPPVRVNRPMSSCSSALENRRLITASAIGLLKVSGQVLRKLALLCWWSALLLGFTMGLA